MLMGYMIFDTVWGWMKRLALSALMYLPKLLSLSRLNMKRVYVSELVPDNFVVNIITMFFPNQCDH